MKQKRLLFSAVLLVSGGLALLVACEWKNWFPPTGWSDFRQWTATASPGDLRSGCAQIIAQEGRFWTPYHTQQAPIPFLFSDSPEYLNPGTEHTVLSRMRLTQQLVVPTHVQPFCCGIYHVNKTNQPQPLCLVVRLADTVTDGNVTRHNTQPAIVTLRRGAYGFATGKPIYAGRACALHWYGQPNAHPITLKLKPGESGVLFSQSLSVDQGISGMFDLETTNAVFLSLYVTFGNVPDVTHGVIAPYEMTIGTNSGKGAYWKRIFQPIPGTPPFDAADTRVTNITHLRFVKQPPDPQQQYLVDETWNLRQENQAKQQIRSKGGARRPFKGDYNVDYTITLPVTSHTGKPVRFAIVVIQRFGIYSGAAATADGCVPLPRDNTALLSHANEGAILIARPTVSAPGRYTFHWHLSGGSYADQDFVLIPLGEIAQ